MQVQQQHVDHGASGPRQLARPNRIAETIRAGVTSKVMLDTHLIDRMHRAAQLSDAQHKAAQRVLELHDEAGFEPVVSASYAPKGWVTGHEDEAPENPAVGRFRRLLGGCSVAAADILHGMCLEQHPGTWRLGSLQAALTDLAKGWGFA